MLLWIFEENLEILLNFVQSPYFTPETVEKERGIIEQEITMYQDSPYWRTIMELLIFFAFKQLVLKVVRCAVGNCYFFSVLYITAVYDTVGGIANWYMGQLHDEEYITPEEYVEKIRAVTAERVRAVCKMYSPDTIFTLSGEEAGE